MVIMVPGFCGLLRDLFVGRHGFASMLLAKRQKPLSMSKPIREKLVFENESISNRLTGSHIIKGDLVKCLLTERLGLVVNSYWDIRLDTLERYIRIEVQFPDGEFMNYSPNELDLVCSDVKKKI